MSGGDPKNPRAAGMILREEFLVPLGMTQAAFASHIGVSENQVHRIVAGKNKITAQMAHRLAQALGTTPEFWMLMQSKYQLANCKPTEPVTRIRGRDTPR